MISGMAVASNDIVWATESATRGQPLIMPRYRYIGPKGTDPNVGLRHLGGAGECVAAAGGTGGESLVQPLIALFRAAVGPCLGVDLAGGLLLDGIVTDRRRRVQGFLEVARFEEGGRFPDFRVESQTPAKQSAWSSRATLASLVPALCTCSVIPSWCWTWWPTSWARM